MKDSGKVIQRFDSNARQTVRNLRIREDFPKYLRNLNPDSAYFDPKTRAMRSNPYAGTDIEPHDDYIGDNFTAKSGDINELSRIYQYTDQVQKIQGQDAASNVFLLSNPTSTEFAFRDLRLKKKEREEKLKQRFNCEVWR
eukprot:UN04836